MSKYGPEKTPYLDTFHAVYNVGFIYRITKNLHRFLKISSQEQEERIKMLLIITSKFNKNLNLMVAHILHIFSNKLNSCYLLLLILLLSLSLLLLLLLLLLILLYKDHPSIRGIKTFSQRFSSFYFSPIDKNTVLKGIRKLNFNKATQDTNIPVKF